MNSLVKRPRHNPFDEWHNNALRIMPPGQVKGSTDEQAHIGFVAACFEIATAESIAVIPHFIEGFLQIVTFHALLIKL